MSGGPHVFGVRHLSPMGAWQLRAFLDEKKPKLVLIEGLADAGGLIADIVRKEVKPPIAILAYTEDQPVRTLVYPIARYSPEYQALLWAKKNKAKSQFFDLPSDIFLGLEQIPDAGVPDVDEKGKPRTANAESEEDEEEDDPVEAEEDGPQESAFAEGEEQQREGIYETFARSHGEPDYDTFWERHFEHNMAPESYRLAAYELGKGLRELEEDTPLWRAENLVREAFMRRELHAAIASGIKPEEIVAVVGAFHAPVINLEDDPLSDEQLAQLKRRPSKLTLMPYSYYKLSSQSGYGAGNQAPAYFELLWACMEEGRMDEISAEYLARVARHLRDSGTGRSTAEVIEGVRLAGALASFKDAGAPVLRDLQDSATTLIGHGERGAIGEALARVEVGTAIGRLPDGVSRTSIQDDFERRLRELKLTKYKESSVKVDLKLDLRENRRVKTEEAAFLDLNRSSFLHQLRVLGVGFAVPVRVSQDSASWAEKWEVRWTPEAEINLVEAVLLGETVELAAAFKIKDRLDRCTSIAEAARIVREASECSLMKSMDLARSAVQRLAAESSDFCALAHAANELGMTVRYGDVRRFDTTPFLPLIEELFVDGSLSLIPAANCDNAAAKKALEGIEALNKVSLEYHDRVDEELWTDQLRKLSDRDDLNPLLSGFACAVLLERNLLSNDELGREVSRRLSPGIDADLGAGWFEGLAKRNRYGLLQRLALWEQLASYVSSLDDDQFKRSLVFLRRSFSEFGPMDKRRIAENLGEIWGVDADTASEVLSGDLSEEEEQQLEDLNDFDFDDL